MAQHKHVLTHRLTHQTRPLSTTAQKKILAYLDEWLSTHRQLPQGKFTELCEEYRCHPDDLEALFRYRRNRIQSEKMKQWRIENSVNYERWDKGTVWEGFKPFAGWGYVEAKTTK